MICAACGDRTDVTTCTECGQSALLDGRYRLEARIGAGATGTTWRASTLVDGKALASVAVKELPVGNLETAKAQELVEREIRVLRELDHPAIPRYWEDLFVGKGRSKAVYIVQDYVDGETLAEEMKRRRYTEGEVVALMTELLHVLGYLHGLRPPVVHRDLKPQNVIRGRDGRLSLIDFGSVRDSMKGELGGSTVAGTFGYMAPEQFRGDAFPVSDLYGLGALAVALLSRREPHTLLDWSGRLKWEEVTAVSPLMAQLLDSLLAPDPQDRLPSASAVLAALEHLKHAHAAGIRGREPLRPVDARERGVLRPLVERPAFRVPPAAALGAEPVFFPSRAKLSAPPVPRSLAGAGIRAFAGMIGLGVGLGLALMAPVALATGFGVASSTSPMPIVSRSSPVYVHTDEPGHVICTDGAYGATGPWAEALYVTNEDVWCTVHQGDRLGGFHGFRRDVWCTEEGDAKLDCGYSDLR